MLQYCRYPLPAPEEQVTCVAPHEDAVALGTSSGCLWLLDGLEGSASGGVRIRAHSGPVAAVSWDGAGLFVASCAEDGTCGVHGRKAATAATDADEWESVDVQHFAVPMRCVGVDPLYASRRDRVFYCGGAGGEVRRVCRGWLGGGTQKVVDDCGSAVRALIWRGPWLAWAADDGVKTMHGATGSPAAHVKPPEGADPALHGLRDPSLFWEGDALWIGWGDVLLRVEMKVDPGDVASDDYGARVRATGEVTAKVLVDVAVCGVVPFDRDHVAVLGFVVDDDDSEACGEEESKALTCASRPELQLVRRDGGGPVQAEALPLRGFEACHAGDYALASTYDCACDAGTWARGDHALLDPETHERRDFSGEHAARAARELMRGRPPVLYVASPRDVVLARVRDCDDQIDLCLARKGEGGARDALATGQQKGATFPTSKAHISVDFHSFWLSFWTSDHLSERSRT